MAKATFFLENCNVPQGKCSYDIRSKRFVQQLLPDILHRNPTAAKEENKKKTNKKLLPRCKKAGGHGACFYQSKVYLVFAFLGMCTSLPGQQFRNKTVVPVIELDGCNGGFRSFVVYTKYSRKEMYTSF